MIPAPLPPASLPSYLQYWGKARKGGAGWHPIAFHSLDVDAVALVVLERSPLSVALATAFGITPDAARALLRLLASVHDVGKFCPGFQAQRADLGLPHGGRGSRDHCSAGRAFWDHPEAMEAVGVEPTGDKAAKLRFLLTAAVGHHGWPPEDNLTPRQAWGGGRNIDDATAFVAFVASRLPHLPEGVQGLDNVPWTVLRDWSWLVTAFVSTCDWVGSDDEQFRYTTTQDVDEYAAESHRRAERAVAAAGLRPSTEKPNPVEVLGRRTPRPMQDSCLTADLDAPLHILEDETGSGKTAAALLLSARWMERGDARGVAFLLPTKATAEGLFGSVRDARASLFPGGGSTVLAYGGRDGSNAWQAVLATAEGQSIEAEVTAWLAKSTRRAFLADATVATIDQALLGVLPTKYQCLRLLGLWRKVLIVDELHAYDAYQNHLLQRLMAWHLRLGGRAILLSATLPRATRAAFLRAGNLDAELSCDAYPLHTQGRASGTSEVPVHAAPGVRKPVLVDILESRSEVVQHIQAASADGRAVAWIRNTVADAHQARRDLLDAGVHAVLLHSRFRRRDRSIREDDLKRRLGPHGRASDRRIVVVATQVIEQSLDIDFDVLVSDLAPLDLLIQRAGRQHRHARAPDGDPLGTGEPDQRGDAILIVHAPPWQDEPDEHWAGRDWGGTRAVYGQLHLHRTLAWLREHDQLVGDEPREGIEYVYRDYDDTNPDGLLKAWQKWQGEQLAGSTIARDVAVKLHDGYDRMIRPTAEENVRTRLGDPSGLVVVPGEHPSADWQDDAIPLPQRILQPLLKERPHWVADQRRYPGALAVVPPAETRQVYEEQEGWK